MRTGGRPPGRVAPPSNSTAAHLADVEPLLRATCTHELDATMPIEEVVSRLATIGSDEGG